MLCAKEIGEIDRKKEIALNKASHEVKVEKTDGDEFDGIDDADDIYPEKEYNEWRIREKDRYKRDRERTNARRTDKGRNSEAVVT